MALKFSGQWRFKTPENIDPISNDAINDFMSLVEKIAAQGDRWDILEGFKAFFAPAAGSTHYRSSSEGWAETDLLSYLEQTAINPPIFIEAFYDATIAIKKKEKVQTPDFQILNEISRKHGIPFEIEPPNLVRLSKNKKLIVVPPAPPSLHESAVEILQKSIARSEQLLADGHPREAVQEMLWVLESLATGFRGIPLPAGEVRGKYFNQIADELKKANPTTTLQNALDWCERLHGYLSSPTGGGVRHGIDLKSAIQISDNEGRLFCNLIRSYVWYLQLEHERLFPS